MGALGASSMSYPTWDNIILKKLKINKVDLTPFGTRPINSTNSSVYTTIKTAVGTPCGIDVPILLKPNGKSKGLIIILGESALRTDDEIEYITNETTDNTILGTPYAIHLHKCPPKCTVYRNIFDALLQKGFSLYITDIIKVWWKGKTGKLLVPVDMDLDIFEQEFKQFKDKNPIIVAWGKKSQNALHRLKEKKGLDTDFLPLPHPGVNNWDSWKLRIFMKAVFKGDLKYAIKVYGKGPIGKEKTTNGSIVAEEAVRSIIEHLQAVKQKRLSLNSSPDVPII